MKKNQSNPTKLIANNLRKRKASEFYNSGFAHITGKHICLKCNTVQSHSFICCSSQSYYLGKIPRTPKHNASRSKWKLFYSYLIKVHTRFIEEPEYTNILSKYNLTKDNK